MINKRGPRDEIRVHGGPINPGRIQEVAGLVSSDFPVWRAPIAGPLVLHRIWLRGHSDPNDRGLAETNWPWMPIYRAFARQALLTRVGRLGG